MSDPERKKAYADIQDYEKENNFIIVPPNPTQEPDGRWNVIKIPLPPGVGQFANLVRRPIESSEGLDPVQFADIARALTRTVSPIDPTIKGAASSLTPQAIKPSIEGLTNKVLFTGNPIVYQNEEKLSPELQVRDNTSGTAQAIGNTLGVSPIKTEAFIKATGGGLASNILNASDKVFTPNQVGGMSVLDSITRRFSSAAGKKTTSGETNKVYDLVQQQDNANAKRTNSAEATLKELSSMTPEEANAKLKEIYDGDNLLYKKIVELKKQEPKRGSWTSTEKAIAQLGVENGARAQYLNTKLQELSTPEEKNNYLKDLFERGIISKTVLGQIKALNSN
jgi:hypothetical protein